MIRVRNVVLLVLALVMVPSARVWAQSHSVINSPHNLSVSGPGAVRSTNEPQVCIFCHTPHNAAPVQPLWNRNLPVTAYTPYSSNSLQAKPGQPTGSSKLCLSCHDGTIALASVLTTNQRINMAGGMTTLPPGHPGNLGTDLSDDHPISFKYDAALVAKNPKLKSPGQLPQHIRLDGASELQCTTCHDAHDNSNGSFLVTNNSNSQLCSSCHNQGATDLAAHMQCAGCHKPHTAPSGPYLLRSATVAGTCTNCHSNTAAAGVERGADVLTDINKSSQHDTRSPVNQMPAQHIPEHVGCTDCHESHTMLAQTAVAPQISPKLGNVAGLNASGAAVVPARFEYEVCFKCHADQAASRPRRILRQVVQDNKRLQFDPTAVSFHPVEAPGRNNDVPSLRNNLTTASLVYCSDCHTSDTSKMAGSTGPDGTHGSDNAGLLVAPYTTADGMAESANTYALCYKCHDRASILADQSFTKHAKHVVDSKVSCSVCHDSHGVPTGQGSPMNNAHLINFDTAIVRPDPVTQRMEYRTNGFRSGECYLTCHGVNHSPKTYSGS